MTFTDAIIWRRCDFMFSQNICTDSKHQRWSTISNTFTGLPAPFSSKASWWNLCVRKKVIVMHWGKAQPGLIHLFAAIIPAAPLLASQMQNRLFITFHRKEMIIHLQLFAMQDSKEETDCSWLLSKWCFCQNWDRASTFLMTLSLSQTLGRWREVTLMLIAPTFNLLLIAPGHKRCCR